MHCQSHNKDEGGGYGIFKTKSYVVYLDKFVNILVNIKKLLISERRIGILKNYVPKQGEDSESL